MSKNLVIVESPAKAKTIGKFLGPDFKVMSSYGHIRDLKKKNFSIDVDNGFAPVYEIPDDKKALVAELKKCAKEAETVWLASDEDREGEAIAWHLFEVLKLKPANTRRIVFHEITKNAILHAIANDERANMPEKAYIARLMKRRNAAIDHQAATRLAEKAAMLAEKGDTAIVERLGEDKAKLATFDGGAILASDILSAMAPGTLSDKDAVIGAVTAALEEALANSERDRLYETTADYRNLLNEYHDGILLCDISEQKVWKKSTDDKAGLEAFFKAHASKYAWESPKFKSYVFFASSDSLLKKAVEYANTLSTDDPEQFAAAMRKQFNRDIKIERVVAGKGDNAITDYLAFGGKRPADKPNSRWNFYTSYKGRMLDAPEEAADVRGAAVSDYQAQLEQQWLKELHKKYKVKVNKKVFNSLK